MFWQRTQRRSRCWATVASVKLRGLWTRCYSWSSHLAVFLIIKKISLVLQLLTVFFSLLHQLCSHTHSWAKNASYVSAGRLTLSGVRWGWKCCESKEHWVSLAFSSYYESTSPKHERESIISRNQQQWNPLMQPTWNACWRVFSNPPAGGEAAWHARTRGPTVSSAQR